MSEKVKYRISFEFVNPISHPQAYHGESPRCRASDVPDSWWHHVERESYDLDDVKSQFAGLTSEMARGELIRNPLIEQTAITAWEPLQS